MYDEWTRRHLLGVSGAVVSLGCLEADGSSESEDEQQTDESTTDDGGDETDEASGEESDETSEADEEAEDEQDDDETDETEEQIHEEYETTEVRAVTPDGDELGSVTAAIADTRDRRYLGLSDTEDLPEDRGMLFVYEEVDDRRFVMRDMDFGIDIVYADDEGVITGIHHAEQPDPGESGEEPEHQYPGRGQYVLEVVYEWTTEHDVSEGDRLAFDLASDAAE